MKTHTIYVSSKPPTYAEHAVTMKNLHTHASHPCDNAQTPSVSRKAAEQLPRSGAYSPQPNGR
jgi:hypothetical protein